MIIISGNANLTFSQEIKLIGGINYGGPVPTHMQDSTSGKPLPGITCGLTANFKFNEHFSFQTELYYSFHGVNYCQSFTRDTNVKVIITNGATGTVPTFYTAYVSGAMKFHYIEMPLLVGYKIGRNQILLGPYVSYLAEGSDAGNVRVVIGHGGFYNDYLQAYNNIHIIHKFDAGIVLGSTMCIYKKISFEIKGTRSFVPLYKPGASSKGPSSKLYNTYVHFSILYSIYDKIKTNNISKSNSTE
jgi:hypothetical protein